MTTTTNTLLSAVTADTVGTGVQYTYLSGSATQFTVAVAATNGAFTASISIQSSTDNTNWINLKTWAVNQATPFLDSFSAVIASSSYMRAVVSAVTGTATTTTVKAFSLSSQDYSTTGNQTVTGNLVVTGTAAHTVTNPNSRFSFWPAFVTGSGTDTTPTAGSRYWSSMYIPYSCTLTGIGFLVGSVGGTNNVIVELHDNAGVLLATSTLAGVLVGTTGTMQNVPFIAPLAIAGPAIYYLTVQFNGTTCRFRTVGAPNFGLANCLTSGSAIGVFGTSAAITPGSVFTADSAPVSATY